jgi:hypothetical protein
MTCLTHALPRCARKSKLFFYCAFVVLLSASFANAQQTGYKKLHGHVPSVVARLHPQGELPGTNLLSVAIGLPLHNQEALTNLLRQIYDPAGPNYRQYLTPEQFTERFGPTPQEYQAVMDFAKSNHLKVTSTNPNRTVVGVEGAAADFERAFQVKLRAYQHPTENRQFLAPDTEPSVPADLPILDVTLSNFIVPHPSNKRVVPSKQNGSPFNVGTGPSGLGYMGSDFRKAFAPGVTNAGTGQSVALVEFDGYYASDVTSYENYAHISTSIAITNVLLNGFNGVPDNSTPGVSDDGEEVTLDIDMVIAMAPGIAKVWVYEEAFPSGNVSAIPLGEVNSELSQIAADNHAKQISCSWLLSINSTTENTFLQYAAQGQTFFTASGDFGGNVGDVTAPSDEPFVTSVGGTTLTTSGAGGPWASEIGWVSGNISVSGGTTNDTIGSSTGGYSTAYEMPWWQQGINMANNMGLQTMRNFPDVAMPADNIFAVTDSGQLGSFSGTSAATPLWAGFNALVNQQAVANGQPVVGFLNPALYAIAQSSSYKTDFHDITVGNNTNGFPALGIPGCVKEFFAGTGFDLCTGLGTPTGSNLINSLLASPDALQVTSNTAFTASGAVGGPFNVTSQSYALSNLGAATLNWSLAGLPNWLQASVNSGSLGGHGTANVTLSLNPTAYAQGAGVYSATLWFTNTTSHFGQNRQFALRVGQSLVQNGGFETGDFSDWLLTGDNGGFDFVDDSTILGITPHTGSYCADLGIPNLPLVRLSQTLPTIPGQAYLLTYWWINPDLGTGTSPNEFSLSWNGTTLFDQVNVPTISGWSIQQFRVQASGPASLLQFGAYNVNGAFALDDISVAAIAMPAFQSVLLTNNVITLTWTTSASQQYKIQYKTALTQAGWNDLGSPITATGATTSTTDSLTNSQRYYRVVWLP